MLPNGEPKATLGVSESIHAAVAPRRDEVEPLVCHASVTNGLFRRPRYCDSLVEHPGGHVAEL